MDKKENSEENSQQAQTEAIKILIEAVRRGQQKGCYSLEQAAQIWINGCMPFFKNDDSDQTSENETKKQEMQSKGIKILIEYIRLAQNSGNGCYTLDETPIILNACSMFIQKNNEAESTEEAEPKEEQQNKV